MADDFTERYGDLLIGSYDCVDRVALNAFFPVGHNPGGFRCWWRRLHGSDDQLDDTHLMRMAGRFARRVKAWAAANGVPVIFCKAGERKHLIAEQYLEENSVPPGVFLILAAKAPASVLQVHRSAAGVITRLEKKREHVYHYSFHIMDPAFGHLTIKMSGHPPFGAQVILNGHEYVAVAAHAEGIGFTKEGNCSTEIADPQRLARVADAWPQQAAIGRLGQVCDRWIYSACLCFGLDLAEQERSGFRYGYSVYQAEYSRNLLFACGAQMEVLFDRVLDRTRSRLDIQLKARTKGEHVLRFEATVHNAKELRCRRSLDNFDQIITMLAGMADRFATALDCADVGFLPDGLLDELPLPAQSGTGRIAGIDLNKPRIRAALSAALALAPAPGGFTVAEHAAKVRQITGQDGYTARQAAYDLRKLRGKQLISKPGRTRRYHVPPDAARTITALLTLRDHVIAPLLAGIRSPRTGRKPTTWTAVDRDYETLRIGMQTLFRHVGIDTRHPPHRQHFVDRMNASS